MEQDGADGARRPARRRRETGASALAYVPNFHKNTARTTAISRCHCGRHAPGTALLVQLQRYNKKAQLASARGGLGGCCPWRDEREGQAARQGTGEREDVAEERRGKGSGDRGTLDHNHRDSPVRVLVIRSYTPLSFTHHHYHCHQYHYYHRHTAATCATRQDRRARRGKATAGAGHARSRKSKRTIDDQQLQDTTPK